MDPAEDYCTFSSSSEDEIFFGPLTLKEIKMRLIPNQVRKADRRARRTNKKKDTEGCNNSFQLIEMHSEPELSSENDLINLNCLPTSTITYANRDTEINNSILTLSPTDSFLEIEKHVAACCISENTSDELTKNDFSEVHKLMNDSPLRKQHNIDTNNIAFENKINNIPTDIITCTLSTPNHSGIKKHSCFKTPVNTLSNIKNQYSYTNHYRNISSPVALYIKYGIVPKSSKNVTPQTVSMIPKLKKHPVNTTSNKENLLFPPSGYLTPRKTVNNKKKKSQSVEREYVGRYTSKK